jgi:hypothetical protein
LGLEGPLLRLVCRLLGPARRLLRLELITALDTRALAS